MADEAGVSTPFLVDGVWLGTRMGATVLRVVDGRIERAEVPAARVPRRRITILPGVVDRHVHLGLVDGTRLAGGPVVEVHDLGWIPEVAVGWRAHPPAGVTVRVAGPFHTAPGGYPSGRPWAPDAAVRGVADTADAFAAVRAAKDRGVDAVKIALHTGLPLLGDDVLRALVDAAHRAGLPALVHAEGPGQAARAIDAGADVLVHAPWSERLPDDVLARGRHMTWISTLAIHDRHDRSTAIDNVRRFRSSGGRVVYGTDMGNGPTPVGPNEAEIRALHQAGLDGDELITAVVGAVGASIPLDRALVSPLPLPGSGEELVTWLSTARRFDTVYPQDAP
ncbi:amidohydrolase family protein [Thermomonospora cellulosilytica]|uniref:Imidazolonepropionase-like amidohydrolase n=1 Tax=Thermomonospora cellulosilytica TaxID=1411118 RepID=A0A7W3N1G5_9ACTN|nr:hypothetical protein [Thermomonospora cellulosilytica]MBA9005801.1 imidazolonepropionase-like amidohydrolase [Thermomonospora cellulosilytica]